MSLGIKSKEDLNLKRNKPSKDIRSLDSMLNVILRERKLL